MAERHELTSARVGKPLADDPAKFYALQDLNEGVEAQTAFQRHHGQSPTALRAVTS